MVTRTRIVCDKIVNDMKKMCDMDKKIDKEESIRKCKYVLSSNYKWACMPWAVEPGRIDDSQLA